MTVLSVLGTTASLVATAAIAGSGIVFFGAWAIAILKGSVK